MSTGTNHLSYSYGRSSTVFALRGRMIQVGELWSDHLILGMVVAT